jgi:putative transposase
MPWKSISVVQARERFVKLVLQAQNSFAQSCRIFGISRKTGYKWKPRFLEEGRRGLRNRPRRPKTPQRTPLQWLKQIRALRRRHGRWGARKIRQHLRRTHPRQKVPAVRTVARWLRRWKLTGRRRRRSLPGPEIRRRALTVRDLFSRYILAVRLLPDQQWWRVRAIFIRLFARYGKPTVIRVDNSFGSTGPAGLSRLSAWWSALDIRVEFIAPGHPEQNGAHEQMHREFKADLTVPVSSTRRAQQRRSNRWVSIYNHVRPHQALQERTPAECYRFGRPEQGPIAPNLKYPKGWESRRVRSNGQIRWRGRLRFIGEAFVGMQVGLRPLGRESRRIYLGQVLLGELRRTDHGGIRPVKYIRHSART